MTPVNLPHRSTIAWSQDNYQYPPTTYSQASAQPYTTASYADDATLAGRVAELESALGSIKDKAAAVPFSSFDSVQPEDLWTYLEIQRTQGIDVFAIPHNSNVSDGWMFSPRKFQGFQGQAAFIGESIDAKYARRQQANEPLFEIHAQSEAQLQIAAQYASSELKRIVQFGY